MGNLNNIFKNVDSALFKQTDSLLSTPFWQQVADRFRLLPESQQKYLNHSLSLLIVILPICIILALITLNFSANSSLALKKDIARSINTITNKQSQFSALERTRLSKTLVSTREEATEMLSKVLKRKGVDTSKIEVTSFESNQKGSNVNASNITFSFKDYSNEELANTFKALVEREKASIPSLKINRDNKSSTLNGSIEIIHYSKGLDR